MTKYETVYGRVSRMLIVARYIEDHSSELLSAADYNEIEKKAVALYQIDALFHAKVKTMANRIASIVYDVYETGTTPKEA
jgi:hypothetical protein